MNIQGLVLRQIFRFLSIKGISNIISKISIVKAGYQSQEIVNSVVLKNIHFREQIGTLEFSSENLKIITALEICMKGKKDKTHFRVLDFGGGGGHAYWVAKRYFPQIKFDWNVIETQELSELAQRKLGNHELKFHCELRKFLSKDNFFDLVFSNSGIQYTDNPMATLNLLLELDSNNVFITRTPLSLDEEPFEYFQYSLGSENGPITGLKIKNFLATYKCTAIPKNLAIQSFSRKSVQIEVKNEGVWDFKKGKVGSFTVIGRRDPEND